MGEASRTAEKDEGGRDVSSRFVQLRARGLVEALRRSLEQERALRRPFLWLIVAAGAGVVLYFSAEREPSLALCLCALAAFVLLAALTRSHARAHALFLALAFLAGGFAAGAWRTARVAAPIVPRVGIGELTGFVEEVDLRRAGARFILRVASAEGFPGRRRARPRAPDDARRPEFLRRRLHRLKGAADAAGAGGAPGRL